MYSRRASLYNFCSFTSCKASGKCSSPEQQRFNHSYIVLSSKTQLVFAKHWQKKFYRSFFYIRSFDEEVLLDRSKYLPLSGH